MQLRLTLILCALLQVFATSIHAQSAPSYTDLSKATERVAEPYFSAYIARDWDRLSPLLADDASFSDPTASGDRAPRDVGRQATEKYFRENYARITRMEFQRIRVFYSGHYAVFEGNLTWALNGKDGKTILTEAMPLVTILRVEGERVAEHRDFADYHPFMEARRKAQPGG
jgi:ketosteroid isomerase-like protein